MTASARSSAPREGAQACRRRVKGRLWSRYGRAGLALLCGAGSGIMVASRMTFAIRKIKIKAKSDSAMIDAEESM